MDDGFPARLLYAFDMKVIIGCFKIYSESESESERNPVTMSEDLNCQNCGENHHRLGKVEYFEQCFFIPVATTEH